MITISPSVKNIFPQTRFGAMIIRGICPSVDRSIMDDLISDEIEQLKDYYHGYERNLKTIASYLSKTISGVQIESIDIY